MTSAAIAAAVLPLAAGTARARRDHAMLAAEEERRIAGDPEAVGD